MAQNHMNTIRFQLDGSSKSTELKDNYIQIKSNIGDVFYFFLLSFKMVICSNDAYFLAASDIYF